MTRAGRGRRVWEVESVGRLAMPVVIGVEVVPPSGALWGVAIAAEVRSEL